MSLRPFGWLMILLGLKWILLLGIISSGIIGLAPDEAQYWTWSQQLAWGYYSKPPGIAWQIWLGTLFAGNTEMGVRFLNPVLATLISLAVYRLARNCRLAPWTAFWAATASAFTPLGLLAGFLAITDGGLALFWTLAAGSFAKMLERDESKAAGWGYYEIALWIFLGALFKWPIYIFWLVIPLGWQLDPKLPRWQAFPAALLSLLGLFPSVIWNMSHDWATFRHVATTLVGGHTKEVGTTPLFAGNFWEFLGAQALLLFPTLFLAAFFAFKWLNNIRERPSKSLLWSAHSSALVLAGYLIYACFARTQGNWCAYIYPMALVPICGYLIEGPTRRAGLIGWSLFASLCLCLLLLLIPLSFCQSRARAGCPPFKAVPFKQNLGGKLLGKELEKTGYNPENDFLFSDTYQTSSLLSFYGPGQKRAYFLNLRGSRRNQFSYWPGIGDEQLGKTGYFVRLESAPNFGEMTEADERQILKELKKYFAHVEFVDKPAYFRWKGKPAKKAWIYRCEGFLNTEPEEKKPLF